MIILNQNNIDNKQFKLTGEALDNIRKAANDPIKLAQELDNFNNNASIYYEERISKLDGSFIQTGEGDSFGTSIILKPHQSRLSSSVAKSEFGRNECISDIGANAKSNEYLQAPKTQRSFMQYNNKGENDQHNISDFDVNKSVSSRLFMTNKMHDKKFLSESYIASPCRENGEFRTSAPRISQMFGKISYISGKDGRSKNYDTISRQLCDSVSESMFDLNYESQGFAVQSDLKFLYQIGRICAESGKFLEEGMLCLDDYINLINFFYPTETQQSGKIYEMKTKAIYMVGLIFYQVNDYEECIKYLTEVKDDLLEIDDIEKYYKCEQIIAEINDKKFY